MRNVISQFLSLVFAVVCALYMGCLILQNFTPDHNIHTFPVSGLLDKPLLVSEDCQVTDSRATFSIFWQKDTIPYHDISITPIYCLRSLFLNFLVLDSDLYSDWTTEGNFGEYDLLDARNPVKETTKTRRIETPLTEAINPVTLDYLEDNQVILTGPVNEDCSDFDTLVLQYTAVNGLAPGPSVEYEVVGCMFYSGYPEINLAVSENTWNKFREYFVEDAYYLGNP